jgi:NPCBM-associated, NEW3 domain of alpha-galactosidase/Cohesin domain
MNKGNQRIASFALLLAVFALPVPVSAATVSISDAEIAPGESVTILIMIKEVTDLGAADINLIYDQSVVNVLGVTNGDFDTLDQNINNVNGITRIGAMQPTNPGLSGSVTLAEVTLKAVGDIRQCSTLNPGVNELKTMPGVDIPVTVVNGTFCIAGTTQTTTSTTTLQHSSGGGTCDHQLEIEDIKQLADAAPGADVQFQVVIKNTGTCAETGVKTMVTNLPGGWTAGNVTTDVGYGETVSVDIPVSIPEDAATGAVTLTFKVIPQDFIGTLEKRVSVNVGEMQAEEVVTLTPPKVETPTPTPPVETPPPGQEPVKAPETSEEERGSIYGPILVVLLLAMLVLAFRRKKGI